MIDEAGPDDKVVSVPVGDPRQEHPREIIHLSDFYKLEIQHFFEVYKELEPGKVLQDGPSWVGRSQAEAEIVMAQRRASASGGQ